MVKKVLLLLKTASVASVVLSAQGIRIPCPILITGACPISDIIKELELSHLRVITSLDKKDDVASALVKVSPDPFVFIYDGSFKGNSRLQWIINSVKAGQCHGDIVKRLPIVITDLVTPREYQEDVFQIHIEKCESCEEELWELLATGNELKMVEEKIAEIDKSHTSVHRFFLSSLAFLYPKMKQKNLMNDYADLENLIADLVEKDTQSKDPSGISELFVTRLYKFEEEGIRPKIVILPEVDEEVLRFRDNYFFCDTAHVHMSDVLFKRIVGNLSKTIGINTIKHILAEEGFIIKTSKRSYLSKMTVTTMHGDPLRLDVLKFDTNKITRLGKTDFFVEFGG